MEGKELPNTNGLLGNPICSRLSIQSHSDKGNESSPSAREGSSRNSSRQTYQELMNQTKQFTQPIDKLSETFLFPWVGKKKKVSKVTDFVFPIPILRIGITNRGMSHSEVRVMVKIILRKAIPQTYSLIYLPNLQPQGWWEVKGGELLSICTFSRKYI